MTPFQAILMPVLRHIDDHRQWVSDAQDFAVQTFEAIMYSIQGDLSYILIESIIHHIHEAGSIAQKGNIATVLSKVVDKLSLKFKEKDFWVSNA